MRRINSDFQTLHISEEGQKLSNRDYFGYVEMDDFACYVLADSLDDEPAVNSARLVVDSIIRDFTEAPTMGKGTLRRYLLRAHTELLKQRAGMHLKVAVVVAVTDYRTLRYCHVGNSRLYLIRNARILEQTKDQSLTQNLLEQERILLDEAARHEERNNLYSFLGERGKPEIQISRKKKLEAGDLLIQLTRGVWEQCGEQELLRIVNDAKETKDILDQVEDCILMEQNSRSIDNYSMAVTAVNKVYQSPKKPVSVKKVLMIVLPVLLVVITVGVTLFLRYRSIQNKTQSLLQYMESGEEYLACSNFQKVAEEYEAAKKLADSLHKEQEYREADSYTKLAEQVILADEALSAAEYQKAQELYLAARQMAVENGNVGLSYIEGQLNRTEGYIEVFDLIAQGERKEEYPVALGIINEKTGKKFMIEATPAFSKQYKKLIDIEKGEKLERIILTHAHIGHYTGLMMLGREVLNTKRLKVFVSSKMGEFLKNNAPWNQLVKLDNIEIIEFKNRVPFVLLYLLNIP